VAPIDLTDGLVAGAAILARQEHGVPR
jgi:hypothetical protein